MASEQYYDFVMRFNAQTEGIRSGMSGITSSVNTLSGTLVGLKAVEWAGAMISAAKDVAMEMVEIGKEAVKMADELDAASRQLTAATGGSVEDLNANLKVINEIYGNNFGETFEEVALGVGAVKQAFRSLNDEGLVDVTEQALTLQDVFEYGIPEQMNAIKSLTKTFGVSTNEAFNLIAQGSQSGANSAGDLLELVNEYGIHYKMMGLSAYDMMNTFAQGAEDAVYQIDYVGDAVKEFGIRSKDGSKASAEGFKILGLDAETATKAFALGGDEAYNMFRRVISGLDDLDNKALRETAGVALFGTKFEDLGADAVIAMGKLETRIDGFKDSLGEIGETKYGNPFARLQAMGRDFWKEFHEDIVIQDFPALQELMDEFELQMPEIKAQVKEALQEVREFFSGNKEEIKEIIGKLPEMTAAVIESVKAIINATKFANDYIFGVSGYKRMISDAGLEINPGSQAPNGKDVPGAFGGKGGGGFGGFASGTGFAPGGLAMVGEHGRELMGVPRGSRVHTAGDTRSMLQGLGNNSGGTSLTVNLSLPSDASQQQVNRASLMTKKAFGSMLDELVNNKNRVSFG